MITDLYSSTDRVLLAEIGQKIKRLRINANMSQKELSERCGLSVFSISQTENGSNTSLLSLLAILRALNALDMLARFFEEEPIDPIAMIDYAKKHPKRKRGSTIDKTSSNTQNTESEW